MLDWQSLLSAVALVFVIEGLLPFISPAGYKTMLERIREYPETRLRNYGLAMICVGLGMLYLVR